MAGAAELQTATRIDFDWQKAEAQFADSQTLVDAATLAMCALEQQLNGASNWLSVDALSSIRSLRQETDADSERLLAERQAKLLAGDFDSVPYAFNVMSTASKVLAAKQDHGKHSEQYQQLWKGFYLDSKRHRDEARRRLTWEYFPKVEQPFDDAADSYVYGGYNSKRVVDNGLSPVGSETVGTDVLIANRREEYTSAAIGKLSRLMLEQAGVEKPTPKLSMLTVSQIETSSQTMLWVMHFDPVRNSRFQEQVGFPKQYITNQVIAEAYRRKQMIAADADPTEQEILGMQALSLQGEGALDLMPLLDEIASEQSGLNIFMGEVVADDFVKDYDAIPAQAEARQAENEDEITAIMDEVLRLAAAETDGFLANRMIDDFVTNMLLDKVEDDPEAARQIFGDETAESLERAIEAQQRGEADEADRIRNEARANAPAATVCTGSECGLQQIDIATAEGQKLAKATKAEAGDIIVRDRVRACKNCNRKTVVYTYNMNKVTKYCEHCKALETTVSKVTPQPTT